jgi:hypothetical protein
MTMHVIRRLSLLVTGATLLSACSGSTPTSPTSTTPTVTAVTVSGANAVNVGSTTNMTATARRSDGSTEDVSSTATWHSSNPAVATVSSGGRVTAVAPGSSAISAAFEGQTGQLPVQVMAVDNVQVVSVTVDTIIVEGTCDTDSLFESRDDGEFSFRFEIERSGTGRTPLWSTERQAFRLGPTPVNGNPGLVFNRNVSQGEDFILWFTASEWDGLLGEDPKLKGVTAGRSHTFQNGRWVANGTSITLGSSFCGATLHWTLSSRPQ